MTESFADVWLTKPPAERAEIAGERTAEVDDYATRWAQLTFAEQDQLTVAWEKRMRSIVGRLEQVETQQRRLYQDRSAVSALLLIAGKRRVWVAKAAGVSSMAIAFMLRTGHRTPKQR